jgi:DUF4097 and DUF4098 domain-containing protein YvlB
MPPPYDPHTQWRVYREQQKAAWRAQRGAWKAQQQAWKARYMGVYGPRVPSVVGPIILIAIGIVGVLIYSGSISPGKFWSWYGHWWPLLLIIAGLALLGEWALDLRRATPVRRSTGFVGILILLAVMGFAAAGWNNFWGPMTQNWGDNSDSFFNFFGLPEHDFDQQMINVQIPANAAIQIQNPRGDVSITAGDTPTIQVQAHEVAFASSDEDAKKIFDAEAAHVAVSGNAVVVKSDGNDRGRTNLTIVIPKTAQVTLNAGHGDVTAAGLGAGINITASHGDVQLSAIQGGVQVHFSSDRGNFSAHQITGDLMADGNCNDLTLSEIKGKVTQTGEIFGDVHLESIDGSVHLHTSVTDLALASLPGDMTLDSDDLRVTGAKGQVQVVTHSKDVDLSQIAGDSSVENRDGSITVEPAGNYAIDAKNSKGDVEVTLAPNAQANVEGHARNGDIVSDFPLPISGDESKTVTGRIGAGGPKIYLSADNGDVRIKRGSGVSSVPMPPPPPDAPHLHTHKALPPQPVTQ